MNKDFPRILTLLREERGLSQKNAAQELGISQPLLSHYEKGIRECGLDFVVKAAELYDVSCDYLLGRSADKHPTQIVISNEQAPSERTYKPSRHSSTGILNALNKKLVSDSLHIIYDTLDKVDNKGLSTEISSFLAAAVYIAFRTLYTSNPKNSRNIFSVPEHVYKSKLHAVMAVTESNAGNIANGLPIEEYKSVDRTERPELSPQIIESEYPELSSSLFNLIQNTEERVKSSKI